MPSSRFKLLAVLFAGLLLMPAVDSALGLSTRFQSTEKRRLQARPTFVFSNVLTFVKQFNQYFKENFGGRNALFYQYSYFKYAVLGVSPLPDKVVVGQRGWFYPGNSMAQVADQHRGLVPTASQTLQQITDRLTYYQQALAKQNIHLYVLIAPDSYSIYPENLPTYWPSQSGSSPFDNFKRYFAQHTTVPLIDVRADLCTAKRHHLVYYQTDTHWNDYGSLVATLTLINRIRRDFPKLPIGGLSDYQVQRIPGSGGDLVTMLALNHAVTDSINYHITPPIYLQAQQKEHVPNVEGGLPTERFISSNRHLPKLLLIGDSFSYSMNQFIPGYFSEYYVVRNNQPKLDLKLIEKECPDIVVIQIVERNINFLFNL